MTEDGRAGGGLRDVACAAMQTAMRTWKAGDGGQPFGQHIDEVFGLLKNALGQGEAGPARGASALASAEPQHRRTPAQAIADPGSLARAADRARGGNR